MESTHQASPAVSSPSLNYQTSVDLGGNSTNNHQGESHNSLNNLHSENHSHSNHHSESHNNLNNHHNESLNNHHNLPRENHNPNNHHTDSHNSHHNDNHHTENHNNHLTNNSSSQQHHNPQQLRHNDPSNLSHPDHHEHQDHLDSVDGNKPYFNANDLLRHDSKLYSNPELLRHDPSKSYLNIGVIPAAHNLTAAFPDQLRHDHYRAMYSNLSTIHTNLHLHHTPTSVSVPPLPPPPPVSSTSNSTSIDDAGSSSSPPNLNNHHLHHHPSLNPLTLGSVGIIPTNGGINPALLSSINNSNNSNGNNLSIFPSSSTGHSLGHNNNNSNNNNSHGGLGPSISPSISGFGLAGLKLEGGGTVGDLRGAVGGVSDLTINGGDRCTPVRGMDQQQQHLPPRGLSELHRDGGLSPRGLEGLHNLGVDSTPRGLGAQGLSELGLGVIGGLGHMGGGGPSHHLTHHHHPSHPLMQPHQNQRPSSVGAMTNQFGQPLVSHDLE